MPGVQLTAEGFTVSRNQIELNQPIKTIGLTNVAIALHPEVEVTVTPLDEDELPLVAEALPETDAPVAEEPQKVDNGIAESVMVISPGELPQAGPVAA